MKKTLLALLVLCSICAAAFGESPREYAAYLEEPLPGAAFEDIEVPGFVTKSLGKDYEFIARSDKQYGTYVAGVRRVDAPVLPQTLHAVSFGAFSSTGITSLWSLTDGEDVVYEFILDENTSIQGYDNYSHLVISFSDGQDYPSQVFQAASPDGRARLSWRTAHGLDAEDPEQIQLRLPVHNYETWKSGATNQPYTFYKNTEFPGDLVGENHLSGESLARYEIIPIGVNLRSKQIDYELVLSENGVRGVLVDDGNERFLYEAGPGFDELLDTVEALLGYRPGEMDFTHKQMVRAEFEWMAGEMGLSNGEDQQIRSWDAGSVVLENALALQRLEELFENADFTVGSVNCPSNAFLKIEYADASSAEFAVAVNSFDLFFCNGMYFTIEEDIIDLFNLRQTEYYQNFIGG